MQEEKKNQINISDILYKIKGAILNFIIPLVSILVTFVLVVFYIIPSYKDLPLKKEELDRKTKTKNILSTKVADLNRLVDFQDMLDENLEVVNKVLVPEPEVPRLLDQATQIAERSGMSLDKLSYSYSSKGTSGGGFDMITVSMGVKANYEQLVLFMELVEKAARYVSIPVFRYSVSSKTDEEGNLSSTFSMDSPYLFVQSAAVTDDPINLDITSSEFIDFMEMLKGLDYYDFINPNIEAVEEEPVEEEPVELEQPAEPVAEPVEEPLVEPVLPEVSDENTETPVEEDNLFLNQ
ncbi:type 4a pilus biogenesis protein PilO [Patescibacteria group bacterium]|nr:type 4a pilus biogenesis protein PilO [Patescibacteria group bacterium]